jgi:hypothetical protein
MDTWRGSGLLPRLSHLGGFASLEPMRREATQPGWAALTQLG